MAHHFPFSSVMKTAVDWTDSTLQPTTMSNLIGQFISKRPRLEKRLARVAEWLYSRAGYRELGLRYFARSRPMHCTWAARRPSANEEVQCH